MTPLPHLSSSRCDVKITSLTKENVKILAASNKPFKGPSQMLSGSVISRLRRDRMTQVRVKWVAADILHNS